MFVMPSVEMLMHRSFNCIPLTVIVYVLMTHSSR